MDPMCQALLLEVGANFLVWLLLGVLVGFAVWARGRRRTEAAVRASEARFRTLVEASADGIAIVAGDGTISYVSPAYERMTGYSAAELQGRSYAELLHPDDQTVAASYVAALLNNPDHHALAEVRIRHKNGTWRIVESSGRLLPDGSLVGYSRDLTEHRRAEEALRELNAHLEQRVAERTVELERALAESRRLTAIFEATSDLVAMATLDGHLLYINNNGRAMMGLDPEAAVESFSFADFYPPEALRQIAEEMLPLAIQQGSVLYETTLQHQDGHHIPVSIVGIVHSGPDGQPERLSAVARDISEQKHIQAELRQARDEAEAASRTKSTFLANMSHEIRTPMNAVIGMTGLLLNTALDPRQRDFVETIRTAGDALLAVINDILDFSKIEAGKLDLEQQPFDLRACIESAIDLLAPRAEEQGINLAYTVADDVPTGVVGDMARLRQILVNLLSNAIKFTEGGEVVVSVRTENREPRTENREPRTENRELRTDSDTAVLGSRFSVLFSVHDTGIGIRPEQMGNLFQSFSQLDPSTTRVYGGTGLGLAISKRLAELMGGRMWAESDGQGQGATFSFTIAAQPAPLPTRPYLRQRRPELAGKRVLIVDDTPTNRRILSLQLQTWGMQPLEVATPQAALALLETNQPLDLAILDMDLPEMDGVALAEAMRARPQGGSLPLMMLTSLGQSGSDPCMQIFAACLSKPVKPSQLYDTLVGIFAHVEAVPAAAHEPTVLRRLAAPSALRILVAEDVALNQKFALLALDDLGYRADIAANGSEALAAVARLPYDVVLMDVQMPEMDGLEATRRIHQLWADGRELPIPQRPYIVAMTANALQGDREACLEAGMDDYISKPVYLEELRAALERAATHQAPPSSALDQATVARLLARPSGHELLALYTTETSELLAVLRAAVVSGDSAALRAAAHSIKGSSRYIGATAVAAFSATIEQRGRDVALGDILPLLVALEEAHAHAVAAISRLESGQTLRV